MHKCYTFLLFMVLLLPSLGLSRWVSEGGVGAGVGDTTLISVTLCTLRSRFRSGCFPTGDAGPAGWLYDLE